MYDYFLEGLSGVCEELEASRIRLFLKHMQSHLRLDSLEREPRCIDEAIFSPTPNNYCKSFNNHSNSVLTTTITTMTQRNDNFGITITGG